MQPAKDEEQAEAASSGVSPKRRSRGNDEIAATTRGAPNSFGMAKTQLLHGGMDPGDGRGRTSEASIPQVKVEASTVTRTVANSPPVNAKARSSDQHDSSNQKGFESTKAGSPPPWFFGNCQASNYLLHTIKEDLAMLETDTSYNKAKYAELHRQELVCIRNNCWFGDMHRSSGEMMVVLPVSPEAHQSKGVRGKQFYLRKKERLFRENVRAAVIQKLKFWDFKNWGVLIPPHSMLEVKQLEFSYPYCKYHRKQLAESPNASFAKDTAPDLDNLMKAFFDALEGLVFVNDCAICAYNRVSKVHSTEFKITFWLKWSKSERPRR